MSKHKNRNQSQPEAVEDGSSWTDDEQLTAPEEPEAPIIEDDTVQTEPFDLPEGELTVATTDQAPMEIELTAPAPAIVETPVEPPKESVPMPEATNPAPAAPAAKPIVQPVRTAATKLTQLCNEYKALASQGLKDDNLRKKAVQKLVELTQLVAASHEREVFETFLGFIMANQALMLSPQLVTDGLVEFADKSKIAKIVDLYLVFSEVAKVQKAKARHERPHFTLNINHIRDLFSKQLAEWVIDRR